MTTMITGSMPPEQIIATYWAETRRINREQALSLTKYREDKQAEAYRAAMNKTKFKPEPKPRLRGVANKRGTPLLEKHGTRIAEMYAARVSKRQIAIQLQISPHSVTRLLMKMGIVEEV